MEPVEPPMPEEETGESSGGGWKGLLALLAVLGIVGFFAPQYLAPLRELYDRAYEKLYPCSRPKTYAIGAVDKRFGLSEKDFAAAVAEAEAVWEKPLGRQLFQRVDSGAEVTVDLVYDYRQADTDKLRKLGITINDDEATYNDLKKRHDALEQGIAPQKAAYDAALRTFDATKAAYDAEVASWNAKGGAPKDVYDRLSAERTAINAQAAALNAQRDALNASIDQANAMVTVINRLAKQLNLTASTYNGVVGDRGSEFEEGLFTGNDLGGTIDIYEFEDRTSLVRVLAHEMGHALGLDHVDDPKAIMYRLNQGKNEKLSQTDIDAVKKLCAMK